MKKITVIVAPRTWNPSEPPQPPIMPLPFQAYRADEVDALVVSLREVADKETKGVQAITKVETAVLQFLWAFPQLAEGGMTEKALGKPYTAFVAAGFTNAELVQLGFMSEVWK